MQTGAVKELVAAGNNALGFMDCRLNATKRFSAALLAVEAEEKSQTHEFVDAPESPYDYCRFRLQVGIAGQKACCGQPRTAPIHQTGDKS